MVSHHLATSTLTYGVAITLGSRLQLGLVMKVFRLLVHSPQPAYCKTELFEAIQYWQYLFCNLYMKHPCVLCIWHAVGTVRARGRAGLCVHDGLPHTLAKILPVLQEWEVAGDLLPFWLC